MDSVRKQLRALTWERVLSGLLMLIVGLLMVIEPEGASSVICLVAGVLLLAAGLVAVVAFFVQGPLPGGVLLLVGLPLLLIGVFFLVNPTDVMAVLAVLFGVMIVIDGAQFMINAVECARFKVRGWVWMLLLSLLLIALGCLVLMTSTEGMVMTLGVALIIDAVLKVVFTFVFRHAIHEGKTRLEQLRRSIDDDLHTVQMP